MSRIKQVVVGRYYCVQNPGKLPGGADYLFLLVKVKRHIGRKGDFYCRFLPLDPSGEKILKGGKIKEGFCPFGRVVDGVSEGKVRKILEASGIDPAIF